MCHSAAITTTSEYDTIGTGKRTYKWCRKHVAAYVIRTMSKIEKESFRSCGTLVTPGGMLVTSRIAHSQKTYSHQQPRDDSRATKAVKLSRKGTSDFSDDE